MDIGALESPSPKLPIRCILGPTKCENTHKKGEMLETPGLSLKQEGQDTGMRDIR